MNCPVRVAQDRAAQADVFDGARSAGDLDDVALRVLVLDQHERAGDVIAHEVLRAQTQGQTDDAETRDRGADVKAQYLQNHQEGDDQDDHAHGAEGQIVDGLAAPLALDGAQLLRVALGGLAVEQPAYRRTNDLVREAQRDKRQECDQNELADNDPQPDRVQLVEKRLWIRHRLRLDKRRSSDAVTR